MERRKTIYIINIRDYRGGTLVLSALCKTLRELGYDARLLIVPYLPETKCHRLTFYYDCIFKNTKFLIKSIVKKYLVKLKPNAKFVKSFRSSANVLNLKGIKIQWHPFINNKTSIVIYPEVVYGNPLGAKNVSRWLLYHYNFRNDSYAYSRDDLFFAYREVFNDINLNPNNYIVTINYFDNNLYRQYNFKERKGNCYILQKGTRRNDLPRHFDGVVFDKNIMSQEDLVEILNTHKYCYSYDPQTFYNTIAVVCGCIPIVVMEEGKTEKDYLESNETHYGIAYGDTPKQIEYAINTRNKCLQSLDYSESNMKNTKHLISIFEKQFGAIRKIKHL